MSTMRDVAREAVTSISTVSNVVNGTRPVATDTALRVHLAMKKLGYHPNALAQSLRNRRSKCLGLVVADIGNPFFAKLLRGAEECARIHGYSSLICNTDEAPGIERDAVQMLESQRADGLLIAPAPGSDDIIEGLHERGMTYVLVDRYTNSLSAPVVTSQNREGAYAAMEHLINLGHSKIGILIGSLEVSTSRERLQGYKDALFAHGIPYQDELVVRSDSLEEATQGTACLLGRKPKPTAVFTTSFPRTIGTMIALRKLSLRCPDDISVVGFDYFDWAEAFDPPLTVVSQDPYKIGFRGAARLIGLLEGNEDPFCETIERIPVQLVCRQSTRSLSNTIGNIRR